MKTLRLLFTIGFAFTAASLVAQSTHFNSQTLGMGNGGTAFIDGYHANFLNPANLMINNTGRKPKRQLGIVGGIGLNTGGSLLNETVYNNYLTTGLTIEGVTRENMLDDWFGADVTNTRSIRTNVDVVPFGFSNRGKNMAFSLATRVRVSEELNVNRGFMELAFYGFDSDNFSTGRPVNFGNSLHAYSEVSLGFAMALPIPLTGLIEKLPFINGINVYVGAAPKLLIGLAQNDIEFNSTLTVDPAGTPNQGITHQFSYFTKTFGELSNQFIAYDNARNTDPDAAFDDYVDFADNEVGLGSGFGLDLGATAEIDVSIPALGLLGKRQVLRVGMSITDMGSITYDETPTEVRASGTFTFDADAGDDEIDDYFTQIGDSLSEDVYTNISTLAVGESRYDLPTMFNLGAALTLGKLTATIDYGSSFNDVGRNIEGSTFILGAEYRLLNFIPLRVGKRYGGAANATSVGFGFDFRFIDFTFGAMAVSDENDGTDISFAWSGLVLRF